LQGPFEITHDLFVGHAALGSHFGRHILRRAVPRLGESAA
jgi:hypothetical protein